MAIERARRDKRDGVLLFGSAGLSVGPVLLAVTVTLIEILRARARLAARRNHADSKTPVLPASAASHPWDGSAV
jgi:hypothetical protein